MNDNDKLEAELSHLRDKADAGLLNDVVFTEKLAHQILTLAETDSAPDGGFETFWRRFTRFKRRVLPGLAALAAVAIVAVVAPLVLHSHLWGQSGPTTGPETTAANYRAPKPQLIQDEFGQVSRIQIGFSQAAVLTPDSLTVNLTQAEQKELYNIMLGAKVAYGEYSPLPGMMTYRISFMNPNGGMEGSYRGDGGMILPGDSKLGQNQVNTFAPNPNLAAFVDQVVISKYAAQLQKDNTIFSPTPEAAAKSFITHLQNPQQAYTYCIPGALFEGLTFDTLITENESLHYGSMALASTEYFDGNTAAIMHFQSGNLFNRQTLDVRADKIGPGWVVTLVGPKVQPDLLLGNPSLSPLGTHHVVIIGNVMPVPPTTNLNRPEEQMTRYRAGNKNPLNQADVIVYERQGITGTNHQQLPTKTSMGHPDPQAVQELQSNPLFQQAVTTAKKNHAALVIVGNSDHLLSQWLVQYALGITPQGVAYSPSGSSYVILTFNSSGQPVFHATSVAPESGSTQDGSGNGQGLSSVTVRNAVDAAELTLEQSARGITQ